MLTAVSLMFPYLFGLGSLLFLVCGSLKTEAESSGESGRLQILAAILIFGVELNHALALLITDLGRSLLAGLLLSLPALVHFIVRRSKGLPRLLSPAGSITVTSLYLAALFVVLVEPVEGWDARSIWFFHAKMIFYNGSVDAAGHWSLPSLQFSHTDYPELVPILAAQTAFVAGYWNEYLPKLSLVALLLPAILSLISLLRQKWWHLVFLVPPLFFTHVWLKNGYMDGYLALYAGLATFYWGRWLHRRARLDFVSGVLFSGIVLDLKNEGMLFCLIAAGLIPVFGLLRPLRSALQGPAGYLRNALLCFLASSGFLLWHQKKQLFHLQNDLGLGLNSLGKIKGRLADGSLATILNHLYLNDDVNLSLGIFLLSLVAALKMGKRPTAGAVFCFCVALLYFTGIVTTYLATPWKLMEHLPTGNRTMLPVHLILLAAALSLFYGKRTRTAAV